MLLLKGASSSDPEERLQELRYTILTKGIPANSEGMVRSSEVSLCWHTADGNPIYISSIPESKAKLIIPWFSPNCAYTSGSSFSMRPHSIPTSTSTSSDKARHPRTRRSKTTRSAHSKAILSSVDALHKIASPEC